jgi:peptidoglycan hydrolase-like protein with peptidoglycan-binding domain
MAYAMNFTPRSLGIAWIWNVSNSVSPHAFAPRPDVMLVQHALNTVMAQLSLTDESGRVITNYLERDGYIGPKTLELIKAFQRNLRSRHLLVKTDGVVDPSSRDGWTSDGNAQYTIVYLNREHRNIHGKMMDDADFPPLLRANVRMNPVVGG